MKITALYAFFFNFVLIFLSIRVINVRRQLKVNVYNEHLKLLVRVHANFIDFINQLQNYYKFFLMVSIYLLSFILLLELME